MDIIEQVKTRIVELQAQHMQEAKKLADAKAKMDACSGAIGELSRLVHQIEQDLIKASTESEKE